MLNRVALVGRLVRDPELRITNNSNKMVSFTIAVNRNFNNQNGQQDADFIRCVAYNKLAELIEAYVSKGSLVSVDGSIRTGSYTNAQNQVVYTTDIFVDNIGFLSPKSTNNNTQPTNNNFNNSYNNNYNFNNPINQNFGRETTNPFPNEEEEDYSGFNIASDDLPF